jgi:hypothetical protein
MKLFAIVVGGEVKGANIEVHDMRLVVAPTITDTYDTLRRQWWGIPKSLHIDCWAEIADADGYDVSLRTEPFTGPERLYFVNLGGYAPGEFSEMHKNVFVVATSPLKAKARAMKTVTNWQELHRDDIHEAQLAMSLVEGAGEQKLFVHLTPTALAMPFCFTSHYTPIGSKR